MKDNPAKHTTASLRADFDSIAATLRPLCEVLEVSNRADHEDRHKVPGETGNLPHWAGTVFNPVMAIIDQIITDKFGISIRESINWGGDVSFYEDVFQALVSVLVPKLRDDADDIKHTPTGKIAKLKGVWHSVNVGYGDGEYEVRYALPPVELVEHQVSNDLR